MNSPSREALEGRRSGHGFSRAVGISLLLSAGLASVLVAQAPEGWHLAGSHPQDYRVGTTDEVRREGRASQYLASSTPQPEGFGTLMQTIGADAYRGKRVRMTGFARAEAVDSWAGLWMRVDGPDKRSLSFDNMEDRPITGTLDWHPCAIVLDVPKKSTAVAFGILLAGRGTVYLDDVRLEVVPKAVATTDRMKKPRRQP